ncbi:MAG: hypothetical protein ACRD0W_21830 [Acidimicrobiales bacterium]
MTREPTKGYVDDRSRVVYDGNCAKSGPGAGKRIYRSRKAARKAARLYRPRSDRMDAYPCGDHWHIGHLAADVVKGQVSRGDVYNR